MAKGRRMTGDMIPFDCCAMTETHYPKGWYVAEYDHQGLTSHGRWFGEREKAEEYLRLLSKG